MCCIVGIPRCLGISRQLPTPTRQGMPGGVVPTCTQQRKTSPTGGRPSHRGPWGGDDQLQLGTADTGGDARPQAQRTRCLGVARYMEHEGEHSGVYGVGGGECDGGDLHAVAGVQRQSELSHRGRIRLRPPPTHRPSQVRHRLPGVGVARGSVGNAAVLRFWGQGVEWTDGDVRCAVEGAHVDGEIRPCPRGGDGSRASCRHASGRRHGAVDHPASHRMASRGAVRVGRCVGGAAAAAGGRGGAQRIGVRAIEQ
mmetsp:Transcript_8791/g.19060  ORF Transcript_8791/g.19060 Transcript_8791/m.19060 type:complete len:254 (+) Transcript_8791:49-810(+)